MTHARRIPAAAKGMERSFADDVLQLTLGAGETFHGETILALTGRGLHG